MNILNTAKQNIWMYTAYKILLARNLRSAALRRLFVVLGSSENTRDVVLGTCTVLEYSFEVLVLVGLLVLEV